MESEDDRWEKRWRKDVRNLLLLIAFLVLLVGCIGLYLLAGVYDEIRSLNDSLT